MEASSVKREIKTLAAICRTLKLQDTVVLWLRSQCYGPQMSSLSDVKTCISLLMI